MAFNAADASFARWLKTEFEWFHRHPELALCEHETTKRIRERLGEIPGVELVDLGLETGALARITGSTGGPAVGLRADIDALPIAEASGLPYSSCNAGRMHACGHDFHTTALLGAARLLSEARDGLKGTVYLLLQPAEEAERGGAKVVAAGLFERYPMSNIYALHTKPNVPVGTIEISSGPFSAAVDHFWITITGKGCHASAPQDGLDPIAAGARLVGALQEIVSRCVSPMETAVVSVTRFASGTTWNVIPETAELEGTVRTFSPEVRRLVVQKMEACVGALTLQGYRAEFKLENGCPATNNDPRAAALIRGVAAKQGFIVKDQAPNMGGEDFSCLQEKVPGALLHIGTGPSAPAHNPAFWVDPGALPGAARLLAEIALTGLDELTAG